MLAGGVALNCVANGKLLRSGIFEDLWIQPAAGRRWRGAWAAYAVWYIREGNRRIVNCRPDAMHGAYLGPSFSDREIERILASCGAVFSYYESFDELAKLVAARLADGKVIGWFQGRMEYGPRALGNRSILGDPRSPEMQKKLNLKNQISRRLPAVCAQRFRGGHRDLFRIGPTFSVYAACSSRSGGEENPGAEVIITKKACTNVFTFCVQIFLPSRTSIIRPGFKAFPRTSNPRYWKLIRRV